MPATKVFRISANALNGPIAPLQDLAGDSNRSDLLFLLPLQFWNPYQNVASLPTVGPSNLRVLLEPQGSTNNGMSGFLWELAGTNSAGTSDPNIPTSSLINYPNGLADDPPSSGKPQVAFTNSPLFREPVMLTNGTGNTYWTNFVEGGTNAMSGFIAGLYTNHPDARIVSATTNFNYRSSGLNAGGSHYVCFQVQFQDNNGTWHPYQGYSGSTAVGDSSAQLTTIKFDTGENEMGYTDNPNSGTTNYDFYLKGGTSCFTNFNFLANTSAGFGDPRAFVWGMSFEQPAPYSSVRPWAKDAGAKRGRNGNYPPGYSFPSTADTAASLPISPFEGMFAENQINNLFESAAGWSTNTYQYDVDGDTPSRRCFHGYQCESAITYQFIKLFRKTNNFESTVPQRRRTGFCLPRARALEIDQFFQHE